MSSTPDSSKPQRAFEIGQSISLGPFDAALRGALRSIEEKKFPARFWAKDSTLWKSRDPAAVRDRLGWLTVQNAMRKETARLIAFADEVKRSGLTHAVLLGMGGSSLCAEVMRHSFRVASGFLNLKVLDSTDPGAVLEIEESVPLLRTLFIVSTKSGTTIETLALFEYFFAKLQAAKGERAGEQFIAITDFGSPLEQTAQAKLFRRTFLNPTDIGGRYSVLSYFGLVPAALIGADIAELLSRAQALADACGPSIPVEENPALKLGAVLAALAANSRDKVTLVLSPQIASFGSWAEQLLAESTGKEGKGLVPVVDEPLGQTGVYGGDRLFVRIHLPGDNAEGAALEAVQQAGHPVVRIALRDPLDLGAEFLRWEIATAAAGAIMEINPFDEPNVQESKDNTKRLLKQGSFPDDAPTAREDGVAVYGHTPGGASGERPGAGLKALLGAHLRQARAGDYVSFLAYLPPSANYDAALRGMRLAVRDRLHVATTSGYGPRYLHSTGQLHKGGPNSGIFIQVTSDPERDAEIAGQRYTFGILERAQALGDFLALQRKGRRVIRLHLGKDVERGLQKIVDSLQSIDSLAPLARSPTGKRL